MQSSGGTRKCVSCGREIAWDANVCQYCGHDYRNVMSGAPAAKKESAMPVIGGILIILASLLYLGLGGLIAAGSSVALVPSAGTSAWGVACGVIVLLLGILCILGGIFALQRKHFGLALVAGILTLPSILGLIGLILVIVSKDEFH